jgi:hypothetical protein
MTARSNTDFADRSARDGATSNGMDDCAHLSNWYPANNHQLHWLYREQHHSDPNELFIHGKTYFNEDEWKAFEAAAPSTTNVVGVRIRTTGGETKLFRDGDYPVLRGTAMLLDDRNAYLWTNGYVPQLDTYIGPETPNPLFITALKSKLVMPPMARILEDIMGLTKINYNSCNYNDGLPVTVRFAEMVGDVLTMGSAKQAERQPFKYYI